VDEPGAKLEQKSKAGSEAKVNKVKGGKKDERDERDKNNVKKDENGKKKDGKDDGPVVITGAKLATVG
ncbi:hypothetical protein FRC11_011950, partial [Ceratobasidium sp. 423]